MAFLRILSIVCLTAGLLAAQQEPSPLIGKIIHVYNPEPGGPLNVDMSGQGFPMTAGADNWMHFTVPTTIQPHIRDFGVRNDYGQGTFWIGRTGLSNGGANAFNLADFGGGNEVWIIIDPSGLPTAAPSILTEAPKVINVFNPWPTTAPVLVLSGGTKKGMLAVANNCGWFKAYLLKPADQSFYLEEVNATDVYGSGGLGSRVPYNLGPEFGSKGSTLWLDTDFNTWLGTDPKKNRPCGYQMAAVVRDFSVAHPDFDHDGLSGDQSVLGMVETNLGPNRKPVRTAKTHTLFKQFDDWFNTKAGTNAETCVDIPMNQSDNGMWLYDSYQDESRGFWPIDKFTNPHNEQAKQSCYVKPDGVSWVNPQPPHNMNFCMESHATFVYQRGQKFEFRGDDDVWVYIDNKLALDLGGIHIPKADTINLDELNLTPGKTYNWDFFYCERQPCGSSLRIKTSIYFRQQRALEAVEVAGKPGTFEIIKRVGGTGACGSVGDSAQVVPVTSLVYKLWNVSGAELETLGDGSFHNGGIVITTPKVVVDTAKINDLPPGNYRVVAYEAASQNVRAEVPFTIRNRSWVQFEPKVEPNVIAGTLVPVVAANRIGEAAPTGALPYTFTVKQSPTGLLVFNDQAGTIPVTALSGATGENGLDTIWVSVDPEIADPVTYILTTTGSTREVKITFNPRPLDLPKVISATIHDEDANGIADRITVTYDRDIAALRPKQVAYRWPASAAQVVVPGADLEGKIAGPVLTLAAQPGKPLATAVLTDGQGVFSSVYPARGGRDSTQNVSLLDKIAPVLVSAVMLPGKTSDTLRLTFSEPIATGAISALPQDLFVYRLSRDGADLRYTPTNLTWTADKKGADLLFPLFPTGVPEAPRSGNLMRIMDGPGRIADAAGNGAGPNSLFRLITGNPRVEIATEPFKKIDPALLTSSPGTIDVTLQPTNADVKDVVTRTGRLGHLIKVDLGDYAQDDDFNDIDPAKVFLEYHVAYFTNHGAPVFRERKVVSCTDRKLFGAEDCRTKRGYLFLGWDFTTLQKQRVATGAYVTRLQFKVNVPGKPGVNGGLDQVWGVLRSD